MDKEKDYLKEFFKICRKNGWECHKKSLKIEGNDCVRLTIQKDDFLLGLILTLDECGSQEGYILNIKSKYLNLWRQEPDDIISFGYDDGILWIGSERWGETDFIEVPIVEEKDSKVQKKS